MDEEDRYTRITLRLPKDLHAALDVAAAATSKSLNAEIVGRLLQSIEQRQGSAGIDMMQSELMDALVRETEITSQIERLELETAELTRRSRALAERVQKSGLSAEDALKRPEISDELDLLAHEERSVNTRIRLLHRMRTHIRMRVRELTDAVQAQVGAAEGEGDSHPSVSLEVAPSKRKRSRTTAPVPKP